MVGGEAAQVRDVGDHALHLVKPVFGRGIALADQRHSGLQAHFFGAHRDIDLHAMGAGNAVADVVAAFGALNHHMVGFIHADLTFEQIYRADEVGHKAAIGGFVNFSRLPDLQNLAFTHNPNTGRHGHGLFLVVGDHHAGHADPLDDVHQLELRALAQLGVQRAQRLIEQQKARAFGQTARQGHPLLLAAGELMRFALGIGFELHHVQHFFHALGYLGFGHAIASQAEGHVVPDIEVGEQRITLEHHVDRPVIRSQTDHVDTAQHDLTGSGRLKTRKHAQQSGLAAPGGAQQRKNLTLLDVQGHIVHRVHIVKLLDDVADLQVRSGRNRACCGGHGVAFNIDGERARPSSLCAALLPGSNRDSAL